MAEPHPLAGWAGVSQRIIANAAARGHADVRAGMFDEWSFNEGQLPPYLATLDSLRQSDRARAGADLQRAAVQYAADVAAEQEEDRRYEERCAVLRRQRDEAQQEIDNSRARIDRFATRDDRRRELLTAPYATDTAEDGAAAPNRPVPAGDESASHWEGPVPPPITPVWRAVMLAGLVAVEVPIQYFIFRYFSGESTRDLVMTWAFVLSISALMVLAPHLAGRFVRRRQATLASTLAVVVAAVLVPAWAFIAWRLGSLREAVMLVPPRDPVTGKVYPGANLASELHVQPWTIAVMFVGLVVLSGGTGFLLGLAHDHPLQTAHARAVRARNGYDRQLAEMAGTRPARRIPVFGPAEGAEALRAVHAEIDAGYEAAPRAYLDAVAAAMANPAATTAISRLLHEPVRQ